MITKKFFEGRTSGTAKQGQESDFEKWTGQAGEEWFKASDFHENVDEKKQPPHLELVVNNISEAEVVDTKEVELEQVILAAQIRLENAKKELEAYKKAKNQVEKAA